MAHHIFWTKADRYPRKYANQVLADQAKPLSPLPEVIDPHAGKVLDSVSWDEIAAHGKKLGVVMTQYEGDEIVFPDKK